MPASGGRRAAGTRHAAQPVLYVAERMAQRRARGGGETCIRQKRRWSARTTDILSPGLCPVVGAA